MSFCLRPVLEAQLVFIGPPLAPSSVLLPAPVGKQIAPRPNTGSDAALLCCGRAGHCPSGCRCQMLQTGQAGGRVVPLPSTSVRGCVPARQAGGRSPPACAAGSSAALCGCALCAGAPPLVALRPGRAPPWSRSAGGLGEDLGAASSLLRAKTQLLVCLCGASSLGDQNGRILSAQGCRPVSVWPLRLLSPSVRTQVSPLPPPGCSAPENMAALPGPRPSSPEKFPWVFRDGGMHPSPKSTSTLLFYGGPRLFCPVHPQPRRPAPCSPLELPPCSRPRPPPGLCSLALPAAAGPRLRLGVGGTLCARLT
ncbi:uncharacterized protein [Vicugna pacos]|uniref:Uncharacterized protein isoform X1 n=1 Tax=Vicugna pacos TaxID=30538 RepID=A0ABM5DJS0_VICPA